MDLAQFFKEDEMENMWIELPTKNLKNHIVGVIHNPLEKYTNNFLEKLNIAIDRCITEKKSITIMGLSISTICLPRSK